MRTLLGGGDGIFVLVRTWRGGDSLESPTGERLNCHAWNSLKIIGVAIAAGAGPRVKLRQAQDRDEEFAVVRGKRGRVERRRRRAVTEGGLLVAPKVARLPSSAHEPVCEIDFALESALDCGGVEKPPRLLDFGAAFAEPRPTPGQRVDCCGHSSPT